MAWHNILGTLGKLAQKKTLKKWLMEAFFCLTEGTKIIFKKSLVGPTSIAMTFLMILSGDQISFCFDSVYSIHEAM